MGWLALGLVLLTLGISGSAWGATASPAHASVQPPAPAPARAGLAVGLAPGDARAVGPLPLSQSLGLSISLQPNDPQALASLLEAQQTPGNPAYHQFLTPDLYHAMFDQPGTVSAAIARYFASYGFQVTPSGPTSFQLMGSVAAADAAFQTTLESYRTPTGATVWAPLTLPTLPSEYAIAVGGVAGLNTFDHPVADYMLPVVPAPVPAASTTSGPRPQVMTVVLSSVFLTDLSGVETLVPPVGLNVSVTGTVTVPGTPAPVAPCTWDWAWGDGSTFSNTTNSCTTDTEHHEYLQPFNQFSAAASITLTVTDAAGTASGSVTDAIVPSMSSQWMERYYQELQMVTNGNNGAGTTIGLDEECDPSFDNGTATYTANVNAFSTVMGLPPLSVSYVGPGGVTCDPKWGDPGWSTETLLDMEWAHAMAPGATLQVFFAVDGPNQPWEDYADLNGGDVLWANTLSDGVFLASNSWGLDESTGLYVVYDAPWAQAAAEGLSFFASAGDCGSADGTTGANVSWPASDPYGVGVGGTILQMTQEGVWVQEYVWNGSGAGTTCDNNQGTGGGWSRVFPAPVFQSQMPGSDKGWAQPTTGSPDNWPIANPRGVPDVAADAATWAALDDNGEWLPTGGTSLASPMWAAMADVILDTIGYGKTPANLIDYHIYADAVANVTYAADFHNVYLGENCNIPTGSKAPTCPNAFVATPQWNPCAGWGSPDVANLTLHWNGTLPAPTYAVSGYVLASGGGPIPGAVVSYGSAAATTNAAGYYLLYFPPGSYTLTATATGYGLNSVGILVNASSLSDVNITLATGLSVPVTGTVFAETGVPVTNAIVTATGGPVPSSAGTDGQGRFLLQLQPASYQLTATAPYFNASSISVTVISSPLTNLVIQLSYTRHTVQGWVLSYLGHVPIWGATVGGESAQGTGKIIDSGVTNSSGEFWVQLPEGNATLTASVYPYTPSTVNIYVWSHGAFNVLILLDPDGSRTGQVSLAVRINDPAHTPSGLPYLITGNHTRLTLWANNTITGTPQLGIYLFPIDTAAGTFSSDNISVGRHGEANVTFTAPFLTAALTDDLVFSVGTPGWSGSVATDLYLIPFFSTCGGGPCAYYVWGVVVSTSGARLAGAQVVISTSGTDATVATATTDTAGIYAVNLRNGTYLAQPSLSGFEPAAQTYFRVNGTPEEVDLVLTANPPGLTSSEQSAFNGGASLFSVDTWAIVPFMVIAMLLIGAVAWRFMIRHPEEGEEKSGPAAAPAGPTPEQEIFGGAPPPPPLPPDGGSPPPALNEAPPPDSPWEITPAPPPPPPDGGLPPPPDPSVDYDQPPPLPEDPNGDAGDDSLPPPPPEP